MIARTAISIMLIFVMVSIVFSPSVSADPYQTKTVDVHLTPGNYDSTSRTINAMDDKNVTTEEKTIREDLPEGTEGKYYGPYLQASLFQFNKHGGYFQFAQNFTIGSDAIINGVSDIWLRIPVRPAQFKSWHVFIDWDQCVDTVALGYYAVSTVPITDHDLHRTVIPYDVTGTSYKWGYLYAGNYFSVDSPVTQEIYEGDYGLYLHLRGIFLPDTQFTVSFTGLLDQFASGPQVYLTQELVGGQTNYSFYFFDSITINGKYQGLKYYNSQVLPLMPAWAFIFVSGIGQQGMSAFKLDFVNNTLHQDYLSYKFAFDALWGHVALTANPYASFYVPFSVEGMANSTEASMQWDINVTIQEDPLIFPTSSLWFDDGSGTPVYSIQFSLTSTIDYLLFTLPLPFGHDHASMIWGAVTMKLYPHESCTIKFLAYTPDYSTITWANIGTTFPNYASDGYLTTDPPYTGSIAGPTLPVVNNANYLPIAITRIMSDSLIAKLTITDALTVYDFGWGKGYSYPGSTHIYVFLENGTSFMYSGKYDDFPKYWNGGIAEWLRSLPFPLNYIFGYIYDGIVWVWDQLVTVGTWIYNIISELIDWIVSIIMDIANKVYDVVVGLTYGIPMLFTLFIVNYLGSTLTTGRIGKATKERRLIKRVTRKLSTHTVAFDKREKAKKELAREERRRSIERRSEVARTQNVHRENLSRQKKRDQEDAKFGKIYEQDRKRRNA